MNMKRGGKCRQKQGGGTPSDYYSDFWGMNALKYRPRR